mmetsp:Transcript_142342/g.248216  ORF Transcript_142342/g.248216 Transcript_142342/m.248216 type:complete len:210 (+) Transcript_142342:1020-1649(+)
MGQVGVGPGPVLTVRAPRGEADAGARGGVVPDPVSSSAVPGRGADDLVGVQDGAPGLGEVQLLVHGLCRGVGLGGGVLLLGGVVGPLWEHWAVLPVVVEVRGPEGGTHCLRGLEQRAVPPLWGDGARLKFLTLAGVAGAGAPHDGHRADAVLLRRRGLGHRRLQRAACLHHRWGQILLGCCQGLAHLQERLQGRPVVLGWGHPPVGYHH